MVRIGCLAQLVSVTVPIMTEPGGGGWRQASYHPFALTSRYGAGHGAAVAAAVACLSAASHVAISGDDLDAVNTLSSLDRVVPKTPGGPGTRRRSPAGRAAAAVLGHDPAVLATAVPGRRCMSF